MLRFAHLWKPVPRSEPIKKIHIKRNKILFQDICSKTFVLSKQYIQIILNFSSLTMILALDFKNSQKIQKIKQKINIQNIEEVTLLINWIFYVPFFASLRLSQLSSVTAFVSSAFLYELSLVVKKPLNFHLLLQ